MFTPEDRARLRDVLLQHASTDRSISGAAVTGSAAEEREDRWSDIDLAFGVSPASAMAQVLSDWTARMYKEHAAVHHVDLRAGAWIYRVFLLSSTLQVDLAFVPAEEFRALAPTFRLVSGKAQEPSLFPAPDPAYVAGMAWLHALHVRSAIPRGQFWQAEYMISGTRDHALMLACIRHGLPAAHGRGIDQLPAAVIAPFAESLVRRLDVAELTRAFGVAVSCLLAEIRHLDSTLGDRLAPTLMALADLPA